MMFLQFFIWGAWYSSIAVYMTNHGMTTLTHWPYTVNPVAAIVAPFFLGLVADRYFATEKVLGTLHLLGGLILFATPQFAAQPTAFILLLLLYNLCYMPTLGLANSLAFHHIQSQEQQFPLIRVFGTIGCIVASLLLCIPLAVYYNFTQLFLVATGVKKIAATQTVGQISETFFMLIMPLLFLRLGVKKMLMMGMAAWALRYALFALGAPHAIFWMILIGIALHGPCYDFFFVTGQIYVDKKSTPAIRGQAQGFLVLVTYGVGMLIGVQIAGNVYDRFLAGGTALTLEQWRSFWILPAAFAAAVLVFFGALFKAPAPTATEVGQQPVR